MPAPIPNVSTGPVDGFLKLDGIDGESTDAHHRGEIDVRSCTFSASNVVAQSGSGGGASAGKVLIQDLHLVKAIDKASVKLFVACASGQHLRSATLTWRRKATQFEFLVITLEDVLVSAVSDAVTSEPDQPPTLESISLHFAKVTLRYVPQKPDGSADTPVGGGWDLVRNKKV